MELEEVHVRAEGLGGANDKSPIARNSLGATKTNTPITRIPQSVSVISREQMDAQGAQSVEQSVGYLAGVSTGVSGTDSRVDEIWVRGFRTGSFANNMYVDGLRPPGSSGGATAMSTRFDSYGLERVEVLRGPSSVLYGQVAPGGIVNLRSKRPPEKFQAEVGIQAGSHGLGRLNVDVGGPLTNDHSWLYRVVGSGSHSGTQVDYVHLNRVFLNPSLTWQPSNRTSLTLLGNFQQDRGGSTFQFLPATGTYLASPYGKLPTSRFLGEPGFNKYDRNQNAIGYSFEQFLGDSFKFHQNVRYIEVSTDNAGVSRRMLQRDGRTLRGNALLNENRSKGWSADTNLEYVTYTGDILHQVLAGFDYQHVDIKLSSATGTAAPLDLFNPVYGSPVVIGQAQPASKSDRIQRGLYLQDQAFWGKWTLTAGLRHDKASATVQTFTRNTREDSQNTANTGRIGMTYAFDNGLSPYASYSTSFEPSSGEDYYGHAFKPVRGKQKEAGIKYAPAGNNGLLTASVYEITQSNISTLDTDPSHTCYGGTCWVQTGQGRVRGLELEGSYQLTRNLAVNGSYTHLNSKVTQSNEADLGKRLAHVPRNIVAARVDYRFDNDAHASVGVRHNGANYGDTANKWHNGARTYVDARLSYALRTSGSGKNGVKLALSADNLFDREYVSCNAAAACFYGVRRSINASLTYSW